MSGMTVGVTAKPRKYRHMVTLQIILDQLGDIPRDVAEALIDTDGMTLITLCKYLQLFTSRTCCLNKSLTSTQIKEAVAILLTHNCLIVKPPTYGTPNDLSYIVSQDSSIEYIYHLNEANILNRQFYSYVLNSSIKLIGNVGASIISALMVNGRLTYKDMLECHTDDDNSSSGSSSSNGSGTNMVTTAMIEQLFKHNIITLVAKLPQPSQYVEPVLAKKTVKRKKEVIPKSSKSFKGGSVDISEGEWKDGNDMVDEDEDDDADMNDGNYNTTTTTIYTDYDDNDEGHMTIDLDDTNSSVLYTINWDGAIRQYHYDTIIDFLTSRFSASVGAIVKIFLELHTHRIPRDKLYPKQFDHQNKQLLSSSLSLSSMATEIQNLIVKDSVWRQKLIDTELVQCNDGDCTTYSVILDELRRNFILMTNDPLQYMLRLEQSRGIKTYRVDISKLIDILCKNSLYSIALNRYGREAARIFRLLMCERNIEQQRVGDLAILPAKEARVKLYALHKDKWIKYVEMSKKSDYAPGQTFYFWYLDINDTLKNVIELMYKSMHNISKRRAQEAKKIQIDSTESMASAVSKEQVQETFHLLSTTNMKMDRSIALIDYTRCKYLL